jgi:hypothetical protein
MKVIDNYLPKDEFKSLQEDILSEFLPWYFFPQSVDDGDGIPQMGHIICQEDAPRSALWSSLEYLIKFLNPSYIFRIKLNMDLKNSQIITKEFHHDAVDENDQPIEHKVLIMYMNTCNGYTLFRDGTKVESIENRALLFSGDLEHTGTTCTDETRRVVLNINYF